jgi:transcriptional regulator with XRE-family HTH domain
VPKVDDYDKICRRLAELISKERERAGLSMTRLAAAAGLAQSAISYLENDKDRAPNLKTLLRVADGLEVDLGTLIQRAIKDIRGCGG